MRRRALPAASLALGLSLLLATGAQASCIEDTRSVEQQVADAEVVFVGTVTGLRNDGRTALIDVESIWKGPDLAAEVVVHGGPDGTNVATSVDRTWQTGVRYLVVPRIEGDRLVDDQCSPTRPYESDMTQAEPADVRTPSAAGAAAASPTPWIVGGVGGALLAAGLVYLVVRRRRSVV